MPDWLRIILAVFACYRGSELITIDRGPCDVIKNMRIKAGVYNLAEDGEPDTDLGRLFGCPWCIGIWLAGLASLLIPTRRKRDKILLWLAIAGGQAFLQSVGGRNAQ